ncbi:50S ribosomal protein L5 [Candidatus Scalindua japonica]|uniref:Large ribosomal subunit protein uL5 n=1 Tax=Candidatus Scalindua japonica TaxID=1284222 RepID=A0A286U2A6_9BACT|nr:50S ribosomal protein L5 [Candidatus Scalindua japonica]GAX62270.1 50S ribosomal protein L5 [Candidatus Scalindua japonica]
MARLIEKYKEEIVPKLMEKYSLKNKLEVPKLEKIVINMGVGRAKENKKLLQDAMKHLAILSCQKPCMTRARKDIAGFKLRKGDPVGCKVTLRDVMAYEFMDRLISIVLPRIKDFRGLSAKSFDGRGCYTLGISELAVFPEIDIDDIEFVQGMDITFVVSVKSDEQSREMLRLFGMPFRS